MKSDPISFWDPLRLVQVCRPFSDIGGIKAPERRYGPGQLRSIRFTKLPSSKTGSEKDGCFLDLTRSSDRLGNVGEVGAWGKDRQRSGVDIRVHDSGEYPDLRFTVLGEDSPESRSSHDKQGVRERWVRCPPETRPGPVSLTWAGQNQGGKTRRRDGRKRRQHR